MHTVVVFIAVPVRGVVVVTGAITPTRFNEGKRVLILNSAL